MKIKVGTLCSGYDSQCMALDRLSRDFPQFTYELIFWSEIDKYAIQAHNAIYPQYSDRNLGDMTKIDWGKVPKIDLLTYSTPCTDISIAGKQQGFTKNSGTRSSILWYTENAINVLRPKYLLMENVAALVSSKFLPLFKKWQNILVSYGYTNYTQVMNAKDFGVPQNRERVFMVSILGGQNFYFPKPFALNKKLRDILDEEVDAKYFLSEKAIKGFAQKSSLNKTKGNGFRFSPTTGEEGVVKTVLCAAGSRDCDNYIIEL